MMNRFQTSMLAVVVCFGLYTANAGHLETDNPRTPIAVVDYGAIIWNTDRIRVFRQTEHGMEIPEFTDEQVDALANTFGEIRKHINDLMAEHNFSLVLRVDSLPDQAKGRLDFPVDKLFVPKAIKNRNEINRVLRKRVAQHHKIELTDLITRRIKEQRALAKENQNAG